MAKDTNKNRQSKKPAKRPSSSPRRNPIYMGFLGLLLAAWIIWRLEPSIGLGKAIMWGVLAGLAWGVFVFAFARSQRQ